MRVKIRTFPTSLGDSVRDAVLEELNPSDIFTVPFSIIVNGKRIEDWDELLKECATQPEPVEIVRFIPVAGG